MRNRLILLAVFAAFTAHSQISEGGLPPSLQPENQSVLAGKMPSAQMIPALDVAKALSEDSHTPGQNRFAAPILTDISLENSGAWQTLPNGDRVWLCALRSTGAKGLTLIFDLFKLPPGASFFAYGSNQQVLGAYTAQSCLPSGKFLIGVLKGEMAYLELYEPSSVQGQSKISIKRVDVAYDQNSMNGAEDFGNGLPCNININCTEGNAWQSPKKGIARILMVFSNGEGWCSGTLIANTSGTFEPYFLTAHHCQIIGNNPDFGLWRFDFDYESANCANPAVEPVPKSVLGSERISYRSETDFMLLKISPIPLNYEVYFNGWNRDNNQLTVTANSVYIHHPLGDIKKISIDTQASIIYPNTLPWGGVFGTSPVNSHWKSITDIGVFQPGSSGSPLMDANKRIVGQLHGGSTATGNDCKVTGAYFGRFNLSWDQGSTPESRIKEWLDPTNTGAVTQNGYFRPAVQGFSIGGNIKTHWGVPIKGVKVEISGSASASVYSDSLGNYQFVNIPVAGNYTLKSLNDVTDLNGVTTYDLVLISKHTLGIEILDSPWKMVAADINLSNSVTTNDIVEGRKVILGINLGFPANTSWRFFPAYTTFNNPANPFQGGLPPDYISVNNLQGNYIGADFKGIKVGDLNNTASGN
jgi:lysyl endopeptidase